MTTSTHVPAGISLGSDLMELLTNNLPVDLCSTMVIACAQLGISNTIMFTQALSSPNADTFRIKFQTMITPILRKRVFTTTLLETVNAGARIYTALRLSPQTGVTVHAKAPQPIPKYGKPYATQNATRRAFLNSTVSSHSFAGLQRRSLAFSQPPPHAGKQPPHRPTQVTAPSQHSTQIDTSQTNGGSLPATGIDQTPPFPPTPPVGTPTYIAQTLYACAATKPILPVQKARIFQFHSGSPTPWSVFSLFSSVSPVFSMLEQSLVPIETAQSVVECCFAARCSTQKGLLRICKFAAAYRQFCSRAVPRVMTTGPSAIIAFTTWLLSLHERGRTVPAAGRYALRVFAEALTLTIPATAPAALSATRSHVIKLAKQAPCFTLKMLLTFGRIAADKSTPLAIRYFAACVMMMVFASFRFVDAVNIREINYEKDTVTGSCLPSKNLKQPFYWVFPMMGFNSNCAWFDVIVDVRLRYHSCKGLPMNFLFTHTKDWQIDDITFPRATYGSTLRTFRLFLAKAGFPKTKHTLHSPRNAFNTFAAQLGWARADRAMIGRWSTRSDMPNKYDRARCVTELRLRYDVVNRIKNGWAPSCDFELPFAHKQPEEVIASDAEETDTSSLASSDTEDEGEIATNTMELGDDDNSKTGYSEPV